MNEPWTARRRDELLTRVTRMTMVSGLAAIVGVGGLSFGLASAATISAEPISSSPEPATASRATSSPAPLSTPRIAAATPQVVASKNLPVARSGGS